MPSQGEVVLNPGGFCFAAEGTRIRTLLGSCISITLWHPQRRIGGMCHYMNPSRSQPVGPHDLDGRYADEAMQLFGNALDRTGTRPQEYEVKMFGGGTQFSTAGGSALDVCRDSVTAGLHLLDRYGYTLSARHLGGAGFRRVDLDLATGQVGLTYARNHVDEGAA